MLNSRECRCLPNTHKCTQTRTQIQSANENNICCSPASTFNCHWGNTQIGEKLKEKPTYSHILCDCGGDLVRPKHMSEIHAHQPLRTVWKHRFSTHSVRFFLPSGTKLLKSFPPWMKRAHRWHHGDAGSPLSTSPQLKSTDPHEAQTHGAHRTPPSDSVCCEKIKHIWYFDIYL